MNKPAGYLVLGVHRKTGRIMLWTGVGGFQMLERVLEREDIEAQLVNKRTAEELTAEKGNEHFVLYTVPVREVTFDRSRIVTPFIH